MSARRALATAVLTALAVLGSAATAAADVGDPLISSIAGATATSAGTIMGHVLGPQ